MSNTTNSLVTVSNVRGYVDNNGTVWLSAEDVARGLGFVEVKQNRVATNGDNYAAIRWSRVNDYLVSFGYPNKVDKDSFIPENMFYRLAMKASNQVAQNFQAIVADNIMPAIRKTGFYKAPIKTLADLEHDIKTIKEQETVIANLASQAKAAQAAVIAAQRSLEQAKQAHCLELAVYQELCKERGVKPNPSVVQQTEDSSVTLQSIYDKVKQQYPLLAMKRVYDFAVKQGYALTGAFDRGRATISQEDATELLTLLKEQPALLQQEPLIVTEQNKTIVAILRQLATTTRTVAEIVETLTKQDIKLHDDKNLSASSLISTLRQNKLTFSPAPKKKNFHCQDSQVPPATILALENYLS